LLSLLIIVPTVIAPSVALAEDKQTLGWIEKARLMPEGLVLHVKMDTGADRSCLHAVDLQQFMKDKKPWVRFELTNRYGIKTIIEREIVKFTKVKRHKGKAKSRPVVRMGICIGDVYREIFISLMDRTRFDYPMLIGRDFITGTFMVDPAISYTLEPECKKPDAM